MYPSVKWPIRRSRPALFVPKTSVVTTTERTFVVRNQNGRAEWVDVRKGATEGDLVEVLGDLKAGMVFTDQPYNVRVRGHVFDDGGNVMSPTHSRKRGRRYRYYTSRALMEGRKSESGTIARVEDRTGLCQKRTSLRDVDVRIPGNACVWVETNRSFAVADG